MAELSPLLCVVMVSGSNPSASTMNMSGAAEVVSFIRRYAPGVYTAFFRAASKRSASDDHGTGGC